MNYIMKNLMSIIINSKLICLEQKSYQLTQYQQRYYHYVDSNKSPKYHFIIETSFFQGNRLNNGLIITCVELSFRDNEKIFHIFLIHNSQSISLQYILFWWNLTTMKWRLWIINEKIFFSQIISINMMKLEQSWIFNNQFKT